MTQYGWQAQQTAGSQTGGGQQQGQGASKTTRTEGFPLEPAAGVPEAAAGAEGSGKNAKSWSAQREATAGDPHLDMASLGLATGQDSGGGGHPIPTDEFLRITKATHLMLLEGQVQGEASGAGSPWQLTPGQLAEAGAASGPRLQPSRVRLEAGAIVRAAIPADAAQQIPEHRYVCNAGELFGWVPAALTAAVASQATTVAGAEDLDEEVPSDGLPELAPADYDRLFALTADAAVYDRPTSSCTVIAHAAKMETVVALGEPVKREDSRWQQIRLVRQPPVTGWLRAAAGQQVESDGAVSELTGDPHLSLENQASGPAVRELEELLRKHGQDPGIVDEVFTANTDQAVRAFQKDKGLRQDGDVGPRTVEALKRGPGQEDSAPLPVGTWVGGYQLRGAPIGHATTTDGASSSAGYSLAGAKAISGSCEVLHQGGKPAVYDSPSGPMWYVRSADNVSGWMLTSNLKPAARAFGPQLPGSSGPEETGVAAELAALCPNGITVAFVVQFTDRKGRAFDTFLQQGVSFATDHQAVALSAGQIVTGSVNLITHKDQITGILASIQRALRGDAETLPAWARVAHLAFFTHGSWTRGPKWGGLQTDGDDWAQDGVLQQGDLEGFARTLTAYCTSDLEVSMFACSTGAEDQTGNNLSAEAIDHMGWGQQATLKGGETGFADLMSDELVAAGAGDAQVMGHSTVGHTVQNPAARLFTGAEDGGVNVFNWVFLPLTEWLGAELADIRASEITKLEPVEYLQPKVFSYYQKMVNQDAAFTTRMSADPELFKVEARERTKIWIHEQYEWWGVISAAAIANRKAYFSSSSIPREPVYKWPPPELRAELAPGTEITIEGKKERIGGLDCYPITWAQDPNSKTSGHHVQAYLPKSWVEER